MTVLVKTKIERKEYAKIAMPKPLFIDGSVEIVAEGIAYLK